MKTSLIIIFVACALSVYPVTSLSRWFSSSWYDLNVALRRYGRCIGDLAPLKDHNLNETDYLINQMRVFLDQGAYDNEQLLNVSALMDNICREQDSSYTISAHIDISKYNSSNAGKENRCRAIDEAMDSMFHVFKRASLNKSEPLDFSAIQFYPNASVKSVSYNLTDLINTSWIKSDVHLELVCRITGSIKEYVQSRISNSMAQDRSHQQQSSFLSTILEYIDRVLDPILGLQKRLYWDSNNRLGMVYMGVSNQLGNLRNMIERTYNSTRNAITNRFSSSNSTNSSSNFNTSNPGMPSVAVSFPSRTLNLTV